MKRHMIIGNSAAGLSAIRAIRRAGDTGPITLVSEENCPAYSPVLTTYYIGGQIERSGLFLVEEEFYRKHGVQTLLGRRALEIDPQKRLVRLDNRVKVSYDDLLLATGASARTLEETDPDALEFVTPLRTLKDAEKIKRSCARAGEVVVIGAGLVSLQTIKAIQDRDLRITALVGSDQILSQQMDAESARLVQKRLEERGVRLLFGREVRRVCRKGGRAEVQTQYNERFGADLVVVGKGVQPNVQLAESAGLEVRTGILVDERMRTNREEVYAAGDAAAGLNTLSQEVEVIATWANACAQGEVAGMNMAGFRATRESQFRENVTAIMGIVAASIGLSNPGPGRWEELRHLDEERGECRKLYFDGPVLVGALLLSRVEDAGVIRNCIANRADVSPWKHTMARNPLPLGAMLGGLSGNWPFFLG